jgi:peptide-methionine (S)-S-oxide reductase
MATPARILGHRAAPPIAIGRCRSKLRFNPPSLERNPMSPSPFSRLSLCAAAIGALAITAFAIAPSRAAEDAVVIPPPAMDAKAADGIQTVVVAGGCFWGVQGVFQHVKGVQQAVSGYAGGAKANPSYEEVSGGDTGHAESVKITYDPSKVSYGELLRIFFAVALNPTELNYQGPDHGTQYRSEIFFSDPAQQKVAEAYIAQLTAAKVYSAPIVTRVDALKAFYPAEGYHQDFLTLHPSYPYIVINDLPKVANLKQMFPAAYSETPVLVGSKDAPPRT